MKKHTLTLIALIVLVSSMTVATQAQTSGRTRLVASIPFQFNVGEKLMPAGDYTITNLNPSSDPAVLQLRTKDGSRSVIIQMNNIIANASEASRLVFNRFGSQYFFAQAWTKGDATGWQASTSKTERLARQELADMKPASETIALKRR